MKKFELIKIIKECIKESGLAPYSMSGGINPDDYVPSEDIGAPISFPISKSRIKQIKDPNGKVNWNKLTPKEKEDLKRYQQNLTSHPEYKMANNAISSVNNQLKKKKESQKSVRDKFMAYRQEKNRTKLKEIVREVLTESSDGEFKFFLALNSDDGRRVFVAKKSDDEYYVADEYFKEVSIWNKPQAGRALRVVGAAHDNENAKLNALVIKKYGTV